MTSNKDPRLLQMADTLEALNISKSILYFLAYRGVAKREEFIEVLQSFTKHTPDYLIDEMVERERDLDQWMRMLPVQGSRYSRPPVTHRRARESGQFVVT
ncbi:MAG: hypothetical protein WBA83_10055 [Burkholderiaceae bacterium]